MCLRTNDATVKVAKKNMICFKRLKGGYSPYYGRTKYEVGKLQERSIEIKGEESPYSYYKQVNVGYHSHVKFWKTIREGLEAPTQIFIIPKEETYIEGWNNNNIKVPNYVSSNIVRMGSVFNPLTYLRLIYYQLTH